MIIMNNECFYCKKDSNLLDLMIKIDKLQMSDFYLNRDQTHPGRSILAFNQHKKELFELTPSELNRFMEDLTKAAKAIQDAFGPDKINYAIYGDIVSHLHVHIVPKYQGETNWGEAFENSPISKKIVSESEYNQTINTIKKQLKNEEVLT
jgi:ATP adenylyltransferase